RIATDASLSLLQCFHLDREPHFAPCPAAPRGSCPIHHDRLPRSPRRRRSLAWELDARGSRMFPVSARTGPGTASGAGGELGGAADVAGRRQIAQAGARLFGNLEG